MCLAVPSRVTASDGAIATVTCFGHERAVSLLLMTEAVSVGDYLLIQAGGFAYEKVAPERAQAALELLGDLCAGEHALATAPPEEPAP